MATFLDRAGAVAASGAWLALGCIRTEPTLFDGYGEQRPASAEMADLPSMPAPAAQPAPLPSSPSPEELAGGNPIAAPVASEGSEGAPVPDEAAVSPEPPPETVAMATDPCAIADSIVCETFEGMTEGVFPVGEGWLPELSSCGSHVIDGSGPSFSGTKALRGDDGGYPECMLHAPLSGERDVYVRTRLFLDGEADLFSQYLSLLEFGSRAAQDDPELRIGLRQAPGSGACQEAPGIDVSGSGLSSGPGTSCTGFSLEPSRWYCLAAHLVRNDAILSLSVSIDGAELLVRDFAGTDEWFGEDLFLKVGRASYGASGLGSVWHDDVAVSRQPIPCVP
jgi:hypothetical protein